MDAASQEPNDKIDANSQAFHMYTRKLTEQLNDVANNLRAEIREWISKSTEDARIGFRYDFVHRWGIET